MWSKKTNVSSKKHFKKFLKYEPTSEALFLREDIYQPLQKETFRGEFLHSFKQKKRK